MSDEQEDDYDFQNVPAETPLSPDEAIIRRHRREKRELQGKILALKKTITKTDKKKKKEIAEQITQMENELERRHNEELTAFKPGRLPENSTTLETVQEAPSTPSKARTNSESSTTETITNPTTPLNSSPGTPKLSRAKKRREKKLEQEKERQQRIEAETEILVENSDWKKEDEQLAAILKDLHLEVHDINPDGHCLYSAISHQLVQYGENEIGVEGLRKRVAEYLHSHKDDFIHYLDESILSTPLGFENYCEDIETTAAWGGQIECQILSKILKKPLRIIQATGPPIIFGEEFTGPQLTLTYHRHKYKLGEHYNSAVPEKL